MDNIKLNKDRIYLFESERLGFGIWNKMDVAEAIELWGDNEVTRYIGGPFSIDKIKARLSIEIENHFKHKIQYWPIFLKINGAFAGCCGLRPYKDQLNVLETGCHLCKNYWGKGFASEATKRVLEYAFNELKIKMVVAGHNPNSIRPKITLTKLGFSYIRDEYYEPTGINHPLYQIDNKTFTQQKTRL